MRIEIYTEWFWFDWIIIKYLDKINIIRVQNIFINYKTKKKIRVFQMALVSIW